MVELCCISNYHDIQLGLMRQNQFALYWWWPYR